LILGHRRATERGAPNSHRSYPPRGGFAKELQRANRGKKPRATEEKSGGGVGGGGVGGPTGARNRFASFPGKGDKERTQKGKRVRAWQEGLRCPMTRGETREPSKSLRQRRRSKTQNHGANMRGGGGGQKRSKPVGAQACKMIRNRELSGAGSK